jgi:hypothetical protein
LSCTIHLDGKKQAA